MWDERYNSVEYAFGKEPNTFLEENFRAIPIGRVLSLAEGEGRNAVFLAKQGYQVTAVDASIVGLNKAKQLATELGVQVEFIHADLADFQIGENQWDGIVSIFCPLPSPLRRQIHQQVAAGLKPGGVFLLEAYTPDQLKNGTGGGTSADLLQTQASLESELGDLTFLHLLELERDVIEGIYHTGIGALVQAIAVRT